MRNTIGVRGAKENNLKNVSLDIPREKLIVLTGLSGSGKSSLAFETIYAEGQRRFLDSLSAFSAQIRLQDQEAGCGFCVMASRRSFPSSRNLPAKTRAALSAP